MTDLPPVVLVCTTYNPNDDSGIARRLEQSRAVRSWAANLQYEGPLHLHIADDGSTLTDWPERLPEEADWPGDNVTFSRQERHGVGASLNKGFRYGFGLHPAAQVLYAVDDWVLRAPLDLTPWVRLLARSPEDERRAIGMVRLGPPHPWLTGRIEMFYDGWGLRLDRHHFAFGHRPALYHRRMLEHYGMFAEDVNAYVCEQDYNDRFIAAASGPDILLALPETYRHESNVEQADINPRG